MASAIRTVPDSGSVRDLKVERAVVQLDRVNLGPAARRLQSLNETLNTDPEWGKLANVNLYEAFDPAQIEKRTAEESLRQYSTLWSGFEWIRNVLVLVPITLTWFSFWLAARDYGALLKTNPELSGNSFLYLWEAGFAGKAELPYLTFSQTALLAALFLLLILLLTVLVHFRKDFATTRATNDAARVRSAVEDAIWEIEKTLSGKRRSDTEAAVVEDLRQAVIHFNSVTDRVGTAVARMDGGAREWIDLTKEVDLRLGMVVHQMRDEADGLRVFSGGLTGNVDKMFSNLELATQTSSALTSVIEKLSGSIQAYTMLQEDKLSEIATQLNALEGQAKGWGHALLKATDDLRFAADKSSSSAASVAGATVTVTSLLKGQGELRDAILETHKAMDDYRKWLPEMLKAEQEGNRNAVAAISNQFKANLEGFARSNAEMGQQQVDALNQIKTEISHTMRAFLNERLSIMQSLEQQQNRGRAIGTRNMIPEPGQSNFAPLALAVGAGVLGSLSIAAVAFFILSRFLAP